MKLLKVFILYPIFLLFLPKFHVFSQEALNAGIQWANLDKKYGFDTELINGIKYYPLHSKSIGDPFLNGTVPIEGEVWLNGRCFRNVKLLYEINLQELVIVYTEYTGGENKIILNSEWIDTFRIDSKSFIKPPFKNSKTHFVEMGYEDSISFYRGYYKEEKFKSDGNNSGYVYSKSITTNYLVIENKVSIFKNKRQFMDKLPEKIQPEIKSYLKFNNIKIRKATSDELSHVFVHLNSLLTQ